MKSFQESYCNLSKNQRKYCPESFIWVATVWYFIHRLKIENEVNRWKFDSSIERVYFKMFHKKHWAVPNEPFPFWSKVLKTYKLFSIDNSNKTYWAVCSCGRGFIVPNKVVLTFDSFNKSLKCDHSNENLSGSTFLWCCFVFQFFTPSTQLENIILSNFYLLVSFPYFKEGGKVL